MTFKFFLVFLRATIFVFPLGLFSQNVDSTLHDGNWGDPTIWSKGMSPSPTDYIFIDHNVHLDVDVILILPGTMEISLTGELCGDHYFTGSYTNYGSIKIDSITTG